MWGADTGFHKAQQSLHHLKVLQQSQIIPHGLGTAALIAGRVLLLQEMSSHLIFAKDPSRRLVDEKQGEISSFLRSLNPVHQNC